MQHKQNHGNLAHPASTRILCHLLPCSRNYHHLLSIISKIDFHTFPWTCTWLDRWAAMPIVAAGRWWLTLVSPMTSDDDVGFQSNQAREPCHLFILFDRERCEHWANLHHRSSWFAVLMRPPDETKFSQTQAHDFGISLFLHLFCTHDSSKHPARKQREAAAPAKLIYIELFVLILILYNIII